MSFLYSHPEDDHEPNYASSITGVAISDRTILLVSTIGFASLGFALYFLILRRLSSEAGEHNERLENARGSDVYGEMLDQSDVATLNRGQRRARAKLRMKKARRAAVPGPRTDPGHADGDGAPAVILEANAMGENGGGNNDFEESNLSRKERQRAAKAMEKKERKAYAKAARLWQEKKQSAMKSEGSRCDDEEKISESSNSGSELSFEKAYPRRANETDPLSEFLFWEPVVNNIKRKANSNNTDIISIVQQIPKMTIREFIERLQQHKSVSIIALAAEFGISIPEVLNELENMNKQQGIVGIPDAHGNFNFVSKEMIRKAIHLGQDTGILSIKIG